MLCLCPDAGVHHSKDTEHAAKQIINAYEQLSQALSHSKNSMMQHANQCENCQTHYNSCTFCKNIYKNFKWKAFILQQGASPNRLRKKLAEDLVKRFGKHGEGYLISHKEDIENLLENNEPSKVEVKLYILVLFYFEGERILISPMLSNLL